MIGVQPLEGDSRRGRRAEGAARGATARPGPHSVRGVWNYRLATLSDHSRPGQGTGARWRGSGFSHIKPEVLGGPPGGGADGGPPADPAARRNPHGRRGASHTPGCRARRDWRRWCSPFHPPRAPGKPAWWRTALPPVARFVLSACRRLPGLKIVWYVGWARRTRMGTVVRACRGVWPRHCRPGRFRPFCAILPPLSSNARMVACSRWFGRPGPILGSNGVPWRRTGGWSSRHAESLQSLPSACSPFAFPLP